MTICLENKTTKEKVVDFQLIYNCDSKLHLELYGLGLKAESKLLVRKDIFQNIEYGILKCKKQEFIGRDLLLKEICTNPKWILKYYNKVKALINEMLLMTHCLEKKIASSLFDISEFLALFDKFVDVMAFRRIPETYFSMECERSSILENLASISVPSYILMLNNAIKLLNKNMDNESINEFIFEYGYLSNFQIKKSKFEDFEYVSEFARNNDNGNHYVDIGKMCLNDESEKLRDIELKVLYCLLYYEEIRHIYQMRLLRNFRLLLEHYDMELFNTTIQDLNRIHESRNTT